MCLSQETLKKADEKFDSSLKRCCPNSLLTIDNGKTMACTAVHNNELGLACDFDFQRSKYFQVTDDAIIIQRKFVDKVENVTVIKKSAQNYCLGLQYDDMNVEQFIFYCSKPCSGTKPCVRYVVQSFGSNLSQK